MDPPWDCCMYGSSMAVNPYMYQPVFIRKKYVHIMYRENIALSEEKLPNNKNETGRMLL